MICQPTHNNRTKTKKCAPKPRPKLSHFVWTTDRTQPKAHTCKTGMPMDDRSNPSRGLGQRWLGSIRINPPVCPSLFGFDRKQCGSSQVLRRNFMCLGSISTGSNPTDPSNTINAHMTEVQRVEIPCLLAWIPPDDARRWLTLGFASSADF